MIFSENRFPLFGIMLQAWRKETPIRFLFAAPRSVKRDDATSVWRRQGNTTAFWMHSGDMVNGREGASRKRDKPKPRGRTEGHVQVLVLWT
jgi:hypothetical protein